MPRTLYIIDGHAQIFRAYYAPFGNLTSPAGEPTRATHVFMQMLANLVRDRKPDYLAMALDVSDGSVFRRQIYPDYKAHRDPPPEDFPAQADRIISILQTLKMPLLQLEGFEADDILATLAAKLAGPDLHVYLVSKDKDLEQLLNEHVSMFDPMKDEVITPERLFELKGWRPEQAIDAQTLIGDSVDNVPGVQGIGPKNAAKLLQKYGTAKAVIEHADELTPKQREKVIEFAPRMEMVRQLVALRTDVPVDFKLEQAACGKLEWAAVRPVLRELGFRRLLDQLPEGPSEPGAPATGQAGGNVGMWERGSGEEKETAGAAKVAKPVGSAVRTQKTREQAPVKTVEKGSDEELLDETVAPIFEEGDDENVAVEEPRASQKASFAIPNSLFTIPDRLRAPDQGDWKLINTPDAFEKFIADLAAQPEFAVDTETTSVNPIDADLVGLSFSWQAGRGFYVPVRSVYGELLPADLIRQKLAPILADANKRKVGHNLKYDLLVLHQAGLPVAGPLFDTMVAAFVLDPTRNSYGLDPLVNGLLGHTMIPITDLIGKGRDQLRMDQVPVEQVAEYAAEDADYTWRLKELFEPRLKDSELSRLFYEVEMPLVSVLTEMERHGISVDVEFLRNLAREMDKQIDVLAQEIRKLIGQPVNLDSPKQLGEILFDKMGLRVVRRTKTARSTDANTLKALAAETDHPVPKLLLEYREIQKLRGTYTEALINSRSKRTGRIHTSFHQTGTVTGRLSSSDPNLQNIPIRTELGRQVRKAFVPRSPDELLVTADYSQIELRVLAHFCEDPALVQAFIEDRDIHAFVAAQVNGVPIEAVTRQMRARAKAVNFGIIYGQTAFGLAQVTGMNRTEAQAFIDAYYQRHPRIREFLNRCIADAQREGCVKTILGRRRPIRDIDSRNRQARALAERLAINSVIQGSAADLMKIAMVELHRRIHAEKLPLRLLLQVHDELVCEAPREQAAPLGQTVAEIMSGAMKLRVPLKVDVHTGENWLDSK